jgi:uncharacterized membrane protein
MIDSNQIEALLKAFKQISHHLETISRTENQLVNEVTDLHGGVNSLSEQIKILTPYFEQFAQESKAGVAPQQEVIGLAGSSLPPPISEAASVQTPAKPPLIFPDNVTTEPDSVNGPAYKQESGTLNRTLAHYQGGSQYRHAPEESNSVFGFRDGVNFEMEFGIKWFSWIGIVVLLIGLAMALSYTFPSFPNGMKILTGILLSGSLYGAGHWLHRQAAFLGRIFQGGGISLGYLTLFAIFFIPDIQLINAPEVGLFCLLSYVGGILFLAHRLNSQTVAVLSLFYGYYTAAYAESALIAFCSAGIISMATVGVTKLHKDWQIVAKINMLGAYLVYIRWYDVESTKLLTNQIYLIFSFVLFHGVSLLRANRGDQVLNLLNLGCFFACVKGTEVNALPGGLFEGLLAATQLGSLFLVNRLRPEHKDESLAQTLLITALILGCLSIFKIFDAQSTSAVLVSASLCLGLISSLGRYSTILLASSYIMLGLGTCTLIMSWSQLPHHVALLSTFWLNSASLILERTAFKTHDKGVRVLLIGLPMFMLWLAIMQFVPSYWRTVSFVLTGLGLMIAGFALPRQVYRWLGVGWILLVGGLSLLGDMMTLTMGYKIILFLVLGGVLLGSSYLYTRMEKKIKSGDNNKEPR